MTGLRGCRNERYWIDRRWRNDHCSRQYCQDKVGAIVWDRSIHVRVLRLLSANIMVYSIFNWFAAYCGRRTDYRRSIHISAPLDSRNAAVGTRCEHISCGICSWGTILDIVLFGRQTFSAESLDNERIVLPRWRAVMLNARHHWRNLGRCGQQNVHMELGGPDDC